MKADNSGPSIWDVMLHRDKAATTSGDTGDIANNHYYMYKQGRGMVSETILDADYVADIARVAALGVRAYSFSISWPRVMPFGRGAVNEAAL